MRMVAGTRRDAHVVPELAGVWPEACDSSLGPEPEPETPALSWSTVGPLGGQSTLSAASRTLLMSAHVTCATLQNPIPRYGPEPVQEVAPDPWASEAKVPSWPKTTRPVGQAIQSRNPPAQQRRHIPEISTSQHGRRALGCLGHAFHEAGSQLAPFPAKLSWGN